jgi:hypothetical protein
MMAPKVGPYARLAAGKRRPAVRRPAADIVGKTAVAAAQAAATAAAVADVTAGTVAVTDTTSATDAETAQVEAAAAARRRNCRRMHTPGGEDMFVPLRPRLHVKTPTGKTITDVKAQIQITEGIHPDNHPLLFDGKLLRKLFTDRTPVWSYGLEWDDAIVLLIIDQLMVFIYCEAGDADFAGTEVVISCRGSDLIGTIKAKIQYETGIRVLQQRLVLVEGKLQNGNTMDLCRLGDGCRLRIIDHVMNFA